jgi:hypothetical protein
MTIRTMWHNITHRHHPKHAAARGMDTCSTPGCNGTVYIGTMCWDCYQRAQGK